MPAVPLQAWRLLLSNLTAARAQPLIACRRRGPAPAARMAACCRAARVPARSPSWHCRVPLQWTCTGSRCSRCGRQPPQASYGLMFPGRGGASFYMSSSGMQHSQQSCGTRHAVRAAAAARVLHGGLAGLRARPSSVAVGALRCTLGAAPHRQRAPAARLRARRAPAPCRRPSSRGQRSRQVGLLGALRRIHRSIIENSVCGRGAAAQVRARRGMKQMRRGPPSGALCGRCWRRSPGGRALWSMRTHMPSRAGGPATLRRRLCEAAARSLRGMGAMSLRKRHGHCHASQACTAPSGTPLCCAQAAGRGAAHS